MISLGTVRRHSKLADATLGPENRVMEVELLPEMSYACGEYLVVLPTNRSDDVHRVLNRFGIAVDTMVKMSGTRKAFLPTDRSEYAYSLIGSYLELGTPISRKQLQTLTSVTENIEEKTKLERLFRSDGYDSELLARGAFLDVLEKFPTCCLSFAAYIDMLQPLHPRVYSIASSPLASVPGYASILYDVLNAPSHFSPDQHFHGVGSTYLAANSHGEPSPLLRSQYQSQLSPPTRSQRSDNHGLRWNRLGTLCELSSKNGLPLPNEAQSNIFGKSVASTLVGGTRKLTTSI
ncbi:hypothetical protein LTR97_007648 [Elasticomyces elasticus]|uniref:FAD-binding FR-type domain-containing protein n=1 Tax=Elasticomyces elasticus TaxID=574655 RepID=A0AAN7W6S6_9PEZI|nr:hypothetical protein LTR97_007648 [Elasticomyces elasticus]